MRGRIRGEQSKGMGNFWKDSRRDGLELNVLWAVGTGEELRANDRRQSELRGKGLEGSKAQMEGSGGGKEQKKVSEA